jgi:hypothetical protein
MQQAQSQILAAEGVLAQEHLEKLEETLAAAIAEGKRIEEGKQTCGVRLVQARAEAEPLWQKRDAVSKARADLDADFEKQALTDPEEYERQRAELTDQWHKFTAQILPLSNIIGAAEDEYRRWEIGGSRLAGRIVDLRRSIQERRQRQRF